MSELVTRWRGDALDLAPRASVADVDRVAHELVRRWSEQHRRYHTTEHLAEVLAAVDELAGPGGLTFHEGVLARVAAWYHDAVYLVAEPGRSERASAELARSELTDLGVATEDVDRVVGLVLDTVSHDLPTDDPLAAVFHDADLWVLAAPPERFDGYCAQVRQEHRHVPPVDYARGRAAVLSPFLERGDVYATDRARDAWTPAARENLRRELERLSG